MNRIYKKHKVIVIGELIIDNNTVYEIDEECVKNKRLSNKNIISKEADEENNIRNLPQNIHY